MKEVGMGGVGDVGNYTSEKEKCGRCFGLVWLCGVVILWLCGVVILWLCVGANEKGLLFRCLIPSAATI